MWTIGPLQVVSHMVQKHLAGEQETHWDKTNKERTSSKMVIFFVCLVPVRFLLTSKVFLYHVTGQLQRVHWILDCDKCLLKLNLILAALLATLQIKSVFRSLAREKYWIDYQSA